MALDPANPRLLIGGAWLDSPARAAVIDPYTGQKVADVPQADEPLIDRAIAAAQEAFDSTRALAGFQRAAFLAAAAKLIHERRDLLARTIVAEAGKPITLAEAEVARAAVTFTAAAEEARRFEGEIIDVQAFAAGKGHFGFVRRFPVGVVYGMTPFNFPLNLVAHKVAPALASGNTIVIKPSPRTPLSALLLGEILSDAGAPPGAVNIVVTSNELAMRPLRDKWVKHVSFTGSVPVGWSIRQQAATHQRVTLELGGNAGLVVHADADMAAAVPAAATAAFGYAGQSCISVQRIFVHDSIYGTFRDALVEHTRAHIRAGDPRERGTSVGPLIDSAAAERVRTLIVDATRAGARLLCGGRFERHVLEPTLLEGVDPKLDICTKEAFAPIATLHAYADFDDALAQVNASPYGLQAGVYTRDIGLAFRAFQRLEVGGVMINQVPTFRLENMPYGGVKHSGLGREGVRYAMEEMSEPRVMIVKLT